MYNERFPNRVLSTFIVIAVLAVLIATAATASELTLPLGQSSEKVVVQTAGGRSTVTIDGDGYFPLEDEGLPVLPFRVVNVLLPQGEAVDGYQVTSTGRTVVSRGYSPQLAPPTVTDDGIEAAASPLVGWSNDSSRFPSTSVVHLGTGYLHGYAVASFAVFPVQLDAGDLVLLEDLALEITTRAETTDSGTITRERFREGFRQRVREDLASFVINPEAAYGYHFQETHVAKPKGGFQPTSFPSLEGSPVDYVIITNDSLGAAYQPLADWKTAKGVPTVVRTTEWIEANYRNGSDLQETIRNFIKDAYAKWGITYVLLGGDTEQVPVRLAHSCFYGGGRDLPVDLYYACLDGDWNADHDQVFGEFPSGVGGCIGGDDDQVDLYAEVYVGRLPTRSTADVNLLTTKIISYESPTDPQYANRIMLLAEVLFPVDWDPGETINLNGADLAQFTYRTILSDPNLDVTRLYETEWLFSGSIHEDHATTIDSLEAGFNQVIHVGHGFRFNMSVGDRSVVNSDADVLTNAPRYSNLYLLNCTAVAFTYFCLAEHFLLAPDGGGVSVAGANESAFPNASSYYMYEYYDLLYLQDVVHIGETFHRSRLNRTPYAELSDNVDLWTHYIYSLLADPEMPLWTNEVDDLAVTYPSSVGLRTTSIQVTVNAGGGPVDSAMVCLSKGTDDYQYGTTDALGQVTFDFRAESAGQIRVVATGRNHARHDGFITVNGESGAYVSLNTIVVDDDNTNGTFGNSDGVIGAGETVDLWMEMINSGASASGNVDLVISSGDPEVTIVDN
ncbi:MAG: hypothetical protein KAJ17_04605, partial [Candidatus Krumholzibacteria bacterium]|nr:hypothetical protein [Candidatus Krumholzibacteria bacterium]